MGMPIANTAPAPVSRPRGGRPVNKYEAILRYKTAMALFRKWLYIGAISRDDLSIMDTAIADKCGLPLCSIYRENDVTTAYATSTAKPARRVANFLP